MTEARVWSRTCLACLVMASVVPALAQQPVARRSETVDVYHGVSVKDPYRWMEELGSPETRAWIEAQDRYARAFSATWPGRDATRMSIAGENVPVVSRAPTKEGERYFYTRSRNSGPSTAFSAFMRIGRDGPELPLINADSLWATDSVRVRRVTPSPDGKLVAYGVGRAASNGETIRVRNVDTGRDLTDRIDGLQGSASLDWARTGVSGFFYTRFTPAERVGSRGAPRDHPRIFFHRLESSQSEDELVFERSDHPEWVLAHKVSDDGHYLVISATVGVDRRSRIYYRDLSQPGSKVLPLTDEGDAEFVFIGNAEHVLWFQTDFGAPLRRVIAVDLAAPARSHWKDLVPEGKDAIDTWVGAHAIGDKLLVVYRQDAVLVARLFDASGRLVSTLRFPQRFNSMWTVSGRQTDPEGLFVLQGVADPGTVYSLDTRSGQSTVFQRVTLPYDPGDFVTEQVFYVSKDGTRIPMYVVRHRKTKLDGSAPGMLYGYGFGSWSGSPYFQPMVTEFMRLGGVWALPNTRGGGEYGEKWAAAGRRRNKQTVIDDYIAASEWLIAHKYVAPGKLVANASSAGGVVAAAAIQQRPALYGASILDYPVIDMFRYQTYSGGVRWTEEYGTVADSADFAALLGYAPYQKLKVGTCYPPTMLSPGEKDQTASPMHAYKFAAALQFANAGTRGCTNPVLLRVSWGAGHQAGASPDDSIDNWADQLAFLAQLFGMKREGPGISSRDQ